MKNIAPTKLVSVAEIALFGFALMLLAATPTKTMIQNTTEQQPVKVVAPADQSNDAILKSA